MKNSWVPTFTICLLSKFVLVESRQPQTLCYFEMTGPNFFIFNLFILALPLAIIGKHSSHNKSSKYKAISFVGLECYSSSFNLLNGVNGGTPIEAELKNCSADAVACLIGSE